MSSFYRVVLATAVVFPFSFASSAMAQVPCPCPVPLTSYQAQVPCTVPGQPGVTCTTGSGTNPLSACVNARACCACLGGITYGPCVSSPDQGGGAAVMAYCNPEIMSPTRKVRCYYGPLNADWVEGATCDEARSKCIGDGGTDGPLCYPLSDGDDSQVVWGGQPRCVFKRCVPQRRLGIFRRCR